MKYEFQSPSVKGYWNTAKFICFCFVSGRFPILQMETLRSRKMK